MLSDDTRGIRRWLVREAILMSGGELFLAAEATTLMQNYSKALLAAECPEDAKVFSNNVPGQNNGAPQ